MPADDDIEAGPGPETATRARAGADRRPRRRPARRPGRAHQGDRRRDRQARARPHRRGDARAPRDPAQPAQGAGERLPRPLRRASRHALLAHVGDVRRRGRRARRPLDDASAVSWRAARFTGGQGAKLAQFVGDRRTLVIFGERATGKSTLLNSLFELVSVDDRFVAIERGPDLPALQGALVLRAARRRRGHRRPRPVRQGAAHGSRTARHRRDPSRRGTRVLQSARRRTPASAAWRRFAPTA